MRNKLTLLLLLSAGCAVDPGPQVGAPPPASVEAPPVEAPPDAGVEASIDAAPVEPDAELAPEPDAADNESSWDPEVHSLDGAHCCVGNDCPCWSAFCGPVDGRPGCCTAECGCGVVSEDGSRCDSKE